MATGLQFTLPDVGEGLTEAEIVTWLVKVGDTVEINDTLVEVETAKSLVELPSPYRGVIAKLHAAEGQTIEVGSPLVTFGSADAAAESTVTQETPEERVEEPRHSILVGYGPSRAKAERRPRRPGYRRTLVPALPQHEPTRPQAPPPVRLYAKQRGVDLTAVTPTGPDGRITRADVDLTARGNPIVPAQNELRSPVKGVRKATAAAMVRSAFTAPHVTEWVTVDVTETLTLLEHLRHDRAFSGARLTPLILIARATLLALSAYPEMNASWDADATEIVQYRDVNLGIATATPRGLLVPNIKAAQAMTTRQLCDAIGELIATARAGTTKPEDMIGGTFTITNIGVFGIDSGTPILNPGEAGILCIGQITRRPWEYRGEIALRSVCTLAMSFDHRLVDGQLGSQVLARIAGLLENPALAFAQ